MMNLTVTLHGDHRCECPMPQAPMLNCASTRSPKFRMGTRMMVQFNARCASVRLCLIAAIGCAVACSGSDSRSPGAGGATADTGVGQLGGAGGTSSNGAGNAPTTGGTTGEDGTTMTGGHTATGTRGDGICQGGSYPTPSTGPATLVISSTDRGQYEGTLWLDSLGVLLFSGMDTSASGVVPATVARLTPPTQVDVLVLDSGTNGLAIDFGGNVLGGSQKVQGIVAIDVSAGTVSTLVNTDPNGKHFNSINDLTVRTDGNIYFTDPDYQLGGRPNETGIKGVYRYSPSKEVSIIDSQFAQPNGISLSPDETILYVADTPANTIRKFTVAADGTTSNKQTFAGSSIISSPDGGAVDCAGNLYWASNAAPGKVVIISPDGTSVGAITVGASDKPTNVAFGGADHKTLYISTSPRKIYSFAANIPGFPY
jgi:gluconolactonase